MTGFLVAISRLYVATHVNTVYLPKFQKCRPPSVSANFTPPAREWLFKQFLKGIRRPWYLGIGCLRLKYQLYRTLETDVTSLQLHCTDSHLETNKNINKKDLSDGGVISSSNPLRWLKIFVLSHKRVTCHTRKLYSTAVNISKSSISSLC